MMKTRGNSTARESVQKAREAVGDLRNAQLEAKRATAEKVQRNRVERLRDIGWDDRADEVASWPLNRF